MDPDLTDPSDDLHEDTQKLVQMMLEKQLAKERELYFEPKEKALVIDASPAGPNLTTREALSRRALAAMQTIADKVTREDWDVKLGYEMIELLIDVVSPWVTPDVSTLFSETKRGWQEVITLRETKSVEESVRTQQISAGVPDDEAW